MGIFSLKGISGKKKEHDVDSGVSHDGIPLLGCELDQVIARRLDDVCQRIDALTLRVDEIAHKMSDMEFKLGLVTASSGNAGEQSGKNIDDIFSKIDEIDRQSNEKRNIPVRAK